MSPAAAGLAATFIVAAGLAAAGRAARAEEAPPMEGTVRSADGVTIHYRTTGQGSPPLLFVHGWSCDGGIWDRQVETFSRRHRVITIDLAGHGRSEAGRSRYTVPAWAEDVRAVALHLDLNGLVLVGHSLGGYVAVESARLMPERIAAVVPVDSILDAEWQPEPDRLEAFFRDFDADFVKAATGFVRDMFREDADPDLVERMVARMTAAPPEVAVGGLRSVFAYDLTAALPQVHAPIRAINADRYPTKIEVNRRYAPRFEAVIMEGVGHFPMLEKPRDFNRLLRKA
ncbi:MAG: alpha/beta fold hydrolase, partial [Candidatus Polarisedimenticolia bacterium]